MGFICANSLSTLACYSPADNADDAEEYSKLYYPAEKDRLFEVVAVVAVVAVLGFYLRKSARSAGDIGASSVWID